MSLFITFEGGEGSGKSTQLEKLAQALKAKGHALQLTREPGGTPIGQAIRRILLANESQAMDPHAELMLYAADRAQHVRQVLRPALTEGKVVLCDRYRDSTLVYQGKARGLDLKLIETLDQWSAAGLKPDLTFLFDCPVEVGLQRSKARLKREKSNEGRFEQEDMEFHERVRQGFLALAKQEPTRFVVLDATEDIEKIHQQILKTVEARLTKS